MNNFGLIHDAKDVVTLEYLQGRYAGGDGSNPYLDLEYLNDNLRGKENGLAPLEGKKIPMSFIPDTILGQVVFGGTVNFANNTLTATIREELKRKLDIPASTIVIKNSATGDYGYQQLDAVFFLAGNAFTFAGMTFDVGDWLISIGTAWKKIDNTDAVTSVNGKIGAVTLTLTDIMGKDGSGNVNKIADSFIASAATWNAKQDAITEQNKLAWSLLSGVPNIVNTFGGKAGAITLRGGSDKRGDVNFSITSGKELQGVVVLADWAKAENRPAYKYGDSDLTGFGSAATKNTDYFATAAQGTKADNALPTSGGTMTGSLVIDHTIDGRAFIRYINRRAKADIGGRADNILTICAADETTLARIGHFGTDDKDNYLFMGYGSEYSADNDFRIYPTQVTWGNKVIYHAGNSNKTDVDWKAKTLTLAGSITGATSITMNGALSGATTGSFSNALAAKTIKISSTDAAAHLEFSRESANYIIAPGGLYFGNAVGAANTTLTIDPVNKRVGINVGATTALTEAFQVNGTAKVNALKIGKATLTWDESHQCIVIDKGFASDSFISAGGINTEAGGGGSDYPRLDTWAAWNNWSASDKAAGVLSAKLGVELHSTCGSLDNRISTLEGGSATTINVTGNGNAVTAVSKSGTTITFAKDATYLLSTGTAADSSKLGGVAASSYLLSSAISAWAKKASLAASDVPNLDASKITSGTFADSYIASAATWNASYRGYSRTQIGNAPNFDDPGVNGLFEVRSPSETPDATGTRPFDAFGPILSLKKDNVMLQIAAMTSVLKFRARQSSNVTMKNVAWNTIYHTGNKPTKSDVGLGNVDNTADANKSVNYATSAGSATNDGGGNDIINTYATKTQLSDGSVTKIGTTDVGSATQPIYLKAGVPTAITGAIDNDTTGNAATATTLKTIRKIWGRNFNGNADVSGAIENATTGSFSGALAAKTIKISSTDAAAHLEFSRESANYIIAPGGLYFGNAVGAANTTLTIDPVNKRVGINVGATTALTEAFQVNGTAKVNTLKIGNVTLSTDTDGNLKIDGNAYTTGFLSAGGINPERATRGFVTEVFTTTAGDWKELNNATGSTNVCVSLYKGNALVYAEVEVTTTKIRVKTEQSQTLKAVIVSID